MTSFFKNKKIAAYIALEHHTRFVIPVMEKLESLGAIPIYIVGQAERSQEITAIERGLNYVHAFDYVEEAHQDEVLENYLLLRDGFVNGIRKDIAVGASTMLTVLDKNLYAVAKEYVGFKYFIDREKPDLCFALHEVNRWGKMFAFWSKKNGIPFISLQEGLANASDFIFLGHVQYSTLNLVWGEKTKKKLIGFEAPADRVIPVGNTHIASEIKSLEKNNTRGNMRQRYLCDSKSVVLLLFSAQPSEIKDLLPLLEFFCGIDDFKLAVKFHPITTKLIIDKWTDNIKVEGKDKILFVHGEERTYDLMAMSDLCIISEPSTTGLEALALGKPLIQLKFPTPDQYPYDFVKDGVALHLTPEQVVQRLTNDSSFEQLVNSDAVESFITNELTDAAGASDRIINIMKNCIHSAQRLSEYNFSYNDSSGDKNRQWSIILPVTVDDPDLFLGLLNMIAENSEGHGNFEVILVYKGDVNQHIQTIFDSIEGDVKILESETDQSLGSMMNLGAQHSTGQNLIFLDHAIAPANDWLLHLKSEVESSSPGTIVGGLIFNPHHNIVHAGIVVDSNNSPVSAYLHLDDKFPHATKKREVQMVDFFLCTSRESFESLGGFDPKSGQYLFQDLCLKANENHQKIVYLPKTRLQKLSAGQRQVINEEAIHFYSKWHGIIWESEQALYDKDGVSALQLDAARMTRAMELNR